MEITSTCAHCGESVERRNFDGSVIWISTPGPAGLLGTGLCPDGHVHTVDTSHALSHMTVEG